MLTPLRTGTSTLSAVVIALVMAAVAPTRASDQAAALLSYPYVVVDSAQGVDTAVQLSNADPENPIAVHCFYENANGHCGADPIRICQRAEQCPPGDSCLSGWTQIDFGVLLTPGQPLAWRASQGLVELPCSMGQCGSGTNAGTVPPIPEDPFQGAMLCYAAAGTSAEQGLPPPVESNDLIGEVTIERYQSTPVRLDVAKYNAIGLQAITGRNNGDPSLVLGGPHAEYESCPIYNLVNHLFDGAPAPASDDRQAFTTLVLLPCTQDLVFSRPPHTAVQYLVFNEFDQRFIVLGTVGPQLVSRLSDINPAVFGFATAGTVAGKSILFSPDSGLFAVAVEQHINPGDPTQTTSAAVNVHHVGVRALPDYVGAKPAICGDGVLDAGEGCDYGNTNDGDCCSSVCQPAAAGQACADDGNACTQDQCDGHGACVHVPMDPLPAACSCCRFTSSAQPLNSTPQTVKGCVGDCDGDGTVTALEVQSCQDLSRGKPSYACGSACDANRNGVVEAFEVALARDNQLHGCPPSSTACAGPTDGDFCALQPSGTPVPLAACDRTNPTAAAFGCPLAPTASATETAPLTPTTAQTPTPTPSVAPTDTPTVQTCVGDCDTSMVVTIDELVLMTSIALGNADRSACVAGDANSGRVIGVDEIISAVRAAIEGCPGRCRLDAPPGVTRQP
jgi:cysteine-rich repeat protein